MQLVSARAVCLAVFVAGVFAAQVQAQHHVKASGWAFGEDFSAGRSFSVFALRHARVVLMDSDTDVVTWTDDEIASGFTDSSWGRFELEGDGGDLWGGRPDVYVKLIFNDGEGVRIINELNQDHSCNTPEHEHDNVEGDLDFGLCYFPTQPGGGGTHAGLFECGRRAYQEYLAMGLGPPKSNSLTILHFSAFPYGTARAFYDTVHWPTGRGTVDATIWHEFGHVIRHTFDGDSTHFWAVDNPRYTYARNHTSTDKTNQGFAFNEGWGEYWGRQYRFNGESANWAASHDMEVEGEVAQALAILEAQFVMISERGIAPAGRSGMVQVLRDNPGSIHSYSDFEAAFYKKFPRPPMLNWPAMRTMREQDPESSNARELRRLESVQTAASRPPHSGSPDDNAARERANRSHLESLRHRMETLEAFIKERRDDDARLSGKERYLSQKSTIAASADLELLRHAKQFFERRLSPTERDVDPKKIDDGSVDRRWNDEAAAHLLLVRNIYSDALNQMEKELRRLQLDSPEETKRVTDAEQRRFENIRARLSKNQITAPGFEGGGRVIDLR